MAPGRPRNQPLPIGSIHETWSDADAEDLPPPDAGVGSIHESRSDVEALPRLASSQTQTPSAAVRADGSRGRRRSLILGVVLSTLEVLVFGALSVFAFWKSADVAPPREDLSTMPAEFTVEVPPLTFGQSEVGPTAVRYREGHTSTTVEIDINIHYGDQAVDVEPTRSNVNLPLPDQAAEVKDCSIANSSFSNCIIGTAPDGTGQLVLLFQPSVDFKSFSAHVELAGIPGGGVGFKKTESRTQVRFPDYRVFGDPNPIDLTEPEDPAPPALPTDVSATYMIAEPDKYEWGSPAPKIINAQRPDGVYSVSSLWRYSNESVPNPLVGIRQDVLDANARNTFVAGIWLGIAGAAAVALLQAVFTGVRRSRCARRRVREVDSAQL